MSWLIKEPLIHVKCVLQQWKLIFNFLKQWKLIFKISINRNGKKLTVRRKKVKNLTVHRKNHHPCIETCDGQLIFLLEFLVFT